MISSTLCSVFMVPVPLLWSVNMQEARLARLRVKKSGQDVSTASALPLSYGYRFRLGEEHSSPTSLMIRCEENAQVAES